MSHDGNIDLEGLELDRALTSLEHFELSTEEEKIDETGGEAFYKRCQEFDYYTIPIEPVTSKLHLELLNLSHSGLGDKGAMALSEALKINKTVKELVLRENWITPKGLEALVAGLSENKTVRYVDFSDNQMGIKRSKLRVGPLITELLSENKQIDSVILKGNKLCDSDCIAICEYLYEDTQLRVLDLSYNDIGPSSGASLASLLKNNGFLKSLNLEWNALRSQGAQFVLEGLQNNNVLEYINLAWCSVSNSGASDIAKVIRENSSLREMNLCHNRIDDSGACEIALAIRENTSINRLNISENPIGRDGAIGFYDALIDNQTMNILDIVDIGVNWRVETILAELGKLVWYLKKNPEAMRQEQERQYILFQEEYDAHMAPDATSPLRSINVYQLEQDVLLQLANERGWRYTKYVPPPEPPKEEVKEPPRRTQRNTNSKKKKKKKKKIPKTKEELIDKFVLL